MALLRPVQKEAGGPHRAVLLLAHEEHPHQPRAHPQPQGGHLEGGQGLAWRRARDLLGLDLSAKVLTVAWSPGVSWARDPVGHSQAGSSASFGYLGGWGSGGPCILS